MAQAPWRRSQRDPSQDLAASSYPGNEFDTNGASITVDGVPNAGEGQLKKGMIVLVNGTISEDYKTSRTVQRTAKTILYEDTIEGPVQSVAADGLSLVVLGQTVLTNQSTIIDPSISTLNNLNQNDLVEVSGFVTGPGTVVATLIDRKIGAPDYQVEGFVAQHDERNKSFTIGNLTVDYRAADIGQMPNSAGNAWNGLLVDIHGAQVSSGGPGQFGVRMTATKVKPERLVSNDGEDVEIEGFVTQVLGQGDFFLGSVHVQASAGTTFEGGTLNDILVDAHLEIYGSMVGGVVNATKVEFEGETELQANVATINSTDTHLDPDRLGRSRHSIRQPDHAFWSRKPKKPQRPSGWQPSPDPRSTSWREYDLGNGSGTECANINRSNPGIRQLRRRPLFRSSSDLPSTHR